MSGPERERKPDVLRVALENIASDCWNAGRPEGAELTAQEYAQEALAVADGQPSPFAEFYARFA